MSEEGSAPNQEAKSLDVLYALAARQLDEQLKGFEVIDAKLGVVFGVSSVILGLLLNSVATVNEIRCQFPFVLVVPLAIYLITVILAILGYRLRSISYPPYVRRMWEEALFWEPETTKRQVLSTWVDAIDSNNAVLRGKSKLADVAIYLLAAEAVAAIASGSLFHFV